MLKRILNRFAKILVVAFAMYLFATLGYFAAKKSAPPPKNEDAHNFSDNSSYENEAFFPNLPAGVTGTYSQEQDFTQDTNDYLVICEGNLVNLYTINKDGDKIFEKVLDIDLNSLKAEDRALLKSGIVLGTQEAFLSLMEDYTS